MNCQIPVHNQIVKITVEYKSEDMCIPVRCAHLQPAVKSLDTALGSNMGMNTLWTLATKRGGECVEVLRSISGPTEIRTRVSAVRGRYGEKPARLVFSGICEFPLSYPGPCRCPLNGINYVEHASLGEG
jgi:hypothetical protein